jgi:hypothetical protein
MADIVLDSEEIRRLRDAGWSNSMLAARFDVPVRSITQSLRSDRRWYSDPTLEDRWKARLPAMKAALRDSILSKSA